jgi:hypothetical protein
MSKICSFQGCGRTHRAKGLCSAHYQQHYAGKGLRQTRRPKGSAGGPCSFDGCENSDKSFGLCAAHYLQQRQGKELAPLKRTAEDIAAEIAAGVRTCSPTSGCGRTLPLSAFYNSVRSRSRLHLWCRECNRHKSIESRYGLTAAAWDAMFESQGSRCAICRSDKPGGGRGWVVDHDHSCCRNNSGRTCGQCVRSILCHQCNITVGYLELHPNIEAALAYVKASHR